MTITATNFDQVPGDMFIYGSIWESEGARYARQPKILHSDMLVDHNIDFGLKNSSPRDADKKMKASNGEVREPVREIYFTKENLTLGYLRGIESVISRTNGGSAGNDEAYGKWK